MEIPAELMQQFVGNSPGHQLVGQMIMRAAHCDTPVLILGDTGTGKSLAAYAIHTLGARRERPFITVNCAAIPAMLFGSLLLHEFAHAFVARLFNYKVQRILRSLLTLLIKRVRRRGTAVLRIAIWLPRGFRSDV